MRKKIIDPVLLADAPVDPQWLNLEAIAEVEVTSEDPAHPIEGALLPGRTTGWRAAGPGRQTVRLRFDRPQRLRRISLHFEEHDMQRAQEYVLRWSPDAGQTWRDIVRQQWNFSPQGATTEIEEHRVDLPAVTLFELTITPDTSGSGAVASLQRMRLA